MIKNLEPQIKFRRSYKKKVYEFWVCFQAALKRRFEEEMEEMKAGMNLKLAKTDFDAYKMLVDAALDHLKRRMEW